VETEGVGQGQTPAGIRQGVLGVTAPHPLGAGHPPRGAPRGLAREAGLASAAGEQRHHRHPVADFQTFGAPRKGHHLPGELVARHIPRLEAEAVGLGHVQVAAADATALDTDHHLAAPGGGIGDALDGKGLASALIDRCLHGNSRYLSWWAIGRRIPRHSSRRPPGTPTRCNNWTRRWRGTDSCWRSPPAGRCVSRAPRRTWHFPPAPAPRWWRPPWG